jgi:hypothetical protein
MDSAGAGGKSFNHQDASRLEVMFGEAQRTTKDVLYVYCACMFQT